MPGAGPSTVNAALPTTRMSYAERSAFAGICCARTPIASSNLAVSPFGSNKAILAPSPPLGERTPRTFIAPCAPEPAGVRSARRPGAQRARMKSATWGRFRHEQAVGAAATGDRSGSKGGFRGRGGGGGGEVTVEVTYGIRPRGERLDEVTTWHTL